MASSVPVVATAVGGIPEIVVPEVTGVLVTPPPEAERIAEALRPLIADPQVRHRLGRAGRTRFEQCFSATIWAKRMRAVYDDVLAEHGQRRGEHGAGSIIGELPAVDQTK